MSLQRFPSALQSSVQKLVRLNLKSGRQQPIAGSFSRVHDNKKHAADTATSNMTASHPFSTVSQSSLDPGEAQSSSVDHDLSKQDPTTLLRSVLQRGAKTQDPKSPGRTWRNRGGGGGGGPGERQQRHPQQRKTKIHQSEKQHSIPRRDGPFIPSCAPTFAPACPTLSSRRRNWESATRACRCAPWVRVPVWARGCVPIRRPLSGTEANPT